MTRAATRRRRASDVWTPDLFNGEGIQRTEGLDRASVLEQAGQEMRDTGSSDLFDVLAEARAPRRPEHAHCFQATDVDSQSGKYLAWHCTTCDCTSCRPLLAEIDSGMCHWCHDDSLAARGELRYAVYSED